jgi:hypothetical protein
MPMAMAPTSEAISQLACEPMRPSLRNQAEIDANTLSSMS